MSNPACVYEIAKDPLSSRLFRFDFSGLAEITEDGETIVSSTITADPTPGVGGITLTPANGSVVGSEVRVRIASGQDGQSYLLTCTATTNAGNILVAKGRLRVRG